MTEFKTGKATVRIHNQPNQEKIKEATVKYLKAVQARKKQKKQEGSK